MTPWTRTARATRHHAHGADGRRHIRGGVLRGPASAPWRAVRGLGVRGQLHRCKSCEGTIRFCGSTTSYQRAYLTETSCSCLSSKGPQWRRTKL